MKAGLRKLQSVGWVLLRSTQPTKMKYLRLNATNRPKFNIDKNRDLYEILA